MSRKRAERQPQWVRDQLSGNRPPADHVSQDAYNQNFFDVRDGSRDLWAYRDQGEFGSYPVHDDYGDESFPD